MARRTGSYPNAPLARDLAKKRWRSQLVSNQVRPLSPRSCAKAGLDMCQAKVQIGRDNMLFPCWVVLKNTLFPPSPEMAAGFWGFCTLISVQAERKPIRRKPRDRFLIYLALRS